MPEYDELDFETPIRTSDAAVATVMSTETVILHPASGRYFGLDGVGTRVWTMLEETTSLARVVAVITEEFDVDAATCERDLRALLRELETKELVNRT